MTAETAHPIFVPDILRVSRPAGLHFREEIVTIDLLDFGDHLFDARVGWIAGAQVFGDALQRLGFIRVFLGERMDSIALDGGNLRADAAETHGEIDSFAGGLVTVRGA